MAEPNIDHQRQSDNWVRQTLIATVITVVVGVIGFAIQITNLARIYEQRQTTVEVKLLSIQDDLSEIKSRIDK